MTWVVSHSRNLRYALSSSTRLARLYKSLFAQAGILPYSDLWVMDWFGLELSCGMAMKMACSGAGIDECMADTSASSVLRQPGRCE